MTQSALNSLSLTGEGAQVLLVVSSNGYHNCFLLPFRLLLHSMVRRLHRAGFYQGSFSPRNIVRQPGPLHVPPAQRTLDQPSYRIIDFGRGINQRVHFANQAKLTARDIQMHAIDERRKALDLFDLNAGIYHT
jgi:hypothetical protein